MRVGLSIKTKLVLSFSVISAVLFAVLFFVAWSWYRAEQLKNVDTFLENEVRWIAETMYGFYAEQQPPPNPTAFAQSQEYLELIQDFVRRRADKPLAYKSTFAILDQVDRVIVKSNGAINLDLSEVTARNGIVYDERVLDDSGLIVSVNDGTLNYRLAYLPIRAGDLRLGAVRLGCLLDPAVKATDAFTVTAVVFLGLAVLVNLVGGLYLATRILRPVEQMRARVDQISEENLNFRLETLAGNDELSRLARTFNNTIERIETAYRSEEALVHDLSHQLRTPLTTLRGSVEIALRRPRSGDEYQRVLEDNLSEIDRLTTLLNTMLNLAKLEGHIVGIQKTRSNPLELICEIVDELAPLWEESEIAFLFRIDFVGQGPTTTVEYRDAALIPEEVLGCFAIDADAFRLKQALVNIFDNAHRYAPRGSVIGIEAVLDHVARRCRLTVANSGEPILPAALDKVFERFYHGPELTGPGVVHTDRQGFGLGLSISKRIVELHGGTIRAFNPESGGAAFEIVLPFGK